MTDMTETNSAPQLPNYQPPTVAAPPPQAFPVVYPPHKYHRPLYKLMGKMLKAKVGKNRTGLPTRRKVKVI